jgi:hypothetical protein
MDFEEYANLVSSLVEMKRIEESIKNFFSAYYDINKSSLDDIANGNLIYELAIKDFKNSMLKTRILFENLKNKYDVRKEKLIEILKESIKEEGLGDTMDLSTLTSQDVYIITNAEEDSKVRERMYENGGIRLLAIGTYGDKTVEYIVETKAGPISRIDDIIRPPADKRITTTYSFAISEDVDIEAIRNALKSNDDITLIDRTISSGNPKAIRDAYLKVKDVIMDAYLKVKGITEQ